MRRFLIYILCLFACLGSAHGGLITLHFEGEVLRGSEPFNGTGQFKFRMTDTVGRLLWAHKMVSKNGKFEDVGHLNIDVVNGRYTVELADADDGMPQLSTEYIHRMTDPHLEVWFSDGAGPFEQVGAYPVSLDPQFDIPADPVILRKLLVDERKENHALKKKLTIERFNRAKAEKQAAQQAVQAEPPPQNIQGQAPQRFQVRMNTQRPEVMGSPNAPVVMMEFTDLQCPICKAFHSGPFKQIKETYVDSGQVLYINAHLPLPMHADATRAAQAVSCAGDQGQFWEMRDLLFANQHDLSAAAIDDYALSLGLEPEAFSECQKQPDIVLEINKQLQFAARMGIRATPTFVIGVLRDGQLDGEVIVGSHGFDYFADRIEALLAGANDPVSAEAVDAAETRE